jgi:hypothetical protein
MNGITHQTRDACLKEFANSKLDLLRGKIPFWMESPTDEMCKNDNKPSAKEREALRTYLNASITCGKFMIPDQFAIIHRNLNEKSRREAEFNVSKKYKSEIQPLIDGKITYAEYFKRKTLYLNDFLKKNGIDPKSLDTKQSAPKRYETYIESWLGQYKSNWPANSPWWGFYYYAIATAKDVDNGKISDQNAAKLIEDKRLKVEQEVAAHSAPKVVTLNCSISGYGVNGEKALTINYTNMQVNGQKAEFYENDILWTEQSSDGIVYHCTLNRLSGFINISIDNFPNLITGRCAPATKQF